MDIDNKISGMTGSTSDDLICENQISENFFHAVYYTYQFLVVPNVDLKHYLRK